MAEQVAAICALGVWSVWVAIFGLWGIALTARIALACALFVLSVSGMLEATTIDQLLFSGSINSTSFDSSLVLTAVFFGVLAGSITCIPLTAVLLISRWIGRYMRGDRFDQSDTSALAPFTMNSSAVSMALFLVFVGLLLHEFPFDSVVLSLVPIASTTASGIIDSSLANGLAATSIVQRAMTFSYTVAFYLALPYFAALLAVEVLMLMVEKLLGQWRDFTAPQAIRVPALALLLLGSMGSLVYSVQQLYDTGFASNHLSDAFSVSTASASSPESKQ